VHTKAAACGVRFLLGIFEAGMLPGIAYYMSRYVFLCYVVLIGLSLGSSL